VLDSSTHTIVQQVEAMKSMVKAFAEYADAPELALAALDVNEIVREVAELYHGMDGLCELVLELADSLPCVQGDATRIRQVLHNVIKNALEAQHGSDCATVLIRTRHLVGKSYDCVELCIEDEGPGVNAELLERVYEPYVTTKTKGGGLGLAIVKKIVEEHGGVVRVENKPRGGAMVTIQLPVAEGLAGASVADAGGSLA